MPEERENPRHEDVLYGENVVEDEEDPVEIETETRKKSPKTKAPKVDTSLKRDIAFIQKKIADLEIAISEMQDKFQKVDVNEFEELKQRLEDIEDLAMVENAGIIELKKMLEGMQEAAQPKIPEELSTRLSAIEEKISTAPQMDTTQIAAFKEDLEKLKGEVESKLSEVKSNVPNLDLITNEIRREVNRSVEWVRSELNSSVEDKTLNLEKQLAQTNAKLSAIPSPDELNSIMHGLSNSFKSFKSLMETRFETEQNKTERKWAAIEDKVSSSVDLKKNIEDFRADMEIKKDSVQLMVDSLEEKLKIPLPEKAVRELEKIRSDWIVNTARLDAIETVTKTFSKQIENLRPTLKKLETFDNVIDLHNEITEKSEEVRQLHNSLQKLVRDLKSLDVEKERATIESKINLLTKGLAGLEERIDKSDEDMSVFQGSMMTVEKGLRDLRESFDQVFKKASKKDIGSLIQRLDEVENDVEGMKSLKAGDKANELVKKINDLEIAVETLKASGSFNDQISELLSRLVFIESRLGAVETMMRSGQGYSAIIVE